MLLILLINLPFLKHVIAVGSFRHAEACNDVYSHGNSYLWVKAMHQHVLLSRAVWGFEQHTAKWTCTLHMQHGNTWASIHTKHAAPARHPHIPHSTPQGTVLPGQMPDILYAPHHRDRNWPGSIGKQKNKQTNKQTNKQKQQPITCAIPSKTHHRRELKSSWPVPR